MNPKIITFLKYSTALLFLGLVFYKIDVRQFIQIIKGISGKTLIWLLVAPILIFATTTFNLALLIKSIKKKIPFRKVLKYNLITKSIGGFFPGRMGEVSIIYFLKKEKVSIGSSVAIVIVDKIITLSLIGLISCIGIAQLFDTILAIQLLLTLIIIATLLISLLLYSKTRAFLKEKILKKHAVHFLGFAKDLKIVMKNKEVILQNYIITFLMLISLSIIIQQVIFSFGVTLPLTTVLMIQCLGMLIAQIPISIAGIGTRESAVIYLYSIINVNSTIIGVTYLALAIISSLTAAAIILYYIKDVRGNNENTN